MQRVGLSIEIGSAILSHRDRAHRESLVNPGRGAVNWKNVMKETVIKLVTAGALRTEDADRLGKFFHAYISVIYVDERVPVSYCPRKVAAEKNFESPSPRRKR